ncbi:MAG: [protein-PII] uridylyltransferase [Desulfobulbaceae bacterium]|jgi:[protein-PII] uridylyltransferase|nr:[protein-PII] uridylyltransferase [Desulfobulbaceae bacterium]
MTAGLKHGRDELEQAWRGGLDGRALLHRYSSLTDEFLVRLFQRAVGEAADSVALLALGGYGRGELFPYSDIDLLLLHRIEDEDQVKELASALLYPLWDAGLDVGHAVRTVEECLNHAEEEYYFQVALLDARLLAGSEELFAELKKRYRDEFVDGRRDVFAAKMRDFLDSRRKKFGSHSYLLEPNIKEGKGGLRDIQAMFWIGGAVFGLYSLADFVSAGLLLPDESNDFIAGWDFLIALRIRLHFAERRRNDQLFLELQMDVARDLAYHDEKGVLAVERFMRDVYAHMGGIAVVCDLFFDHVDEVLGFGKKDAVVSDREVEKGIEIRGNRVHLTATPAKIEAKPHLLMRVFLASARCGLPIHHRSRKLIGASAFLLGDKSRHAPRVAKAFLATLVEAKDVFQVLETMLETGILPMYMPEFLPIQALAQHDIYHIYTVDRHSLQAVAEVRILLAEAPELARVARPTELLCLAALAHDIGKGSGRDHSEEGARLVASLGERLALPAKWIDDLCFLVRYHLFIPENALRRDLNDLTFIGRCAETIGDQRRLALLYCLSIADSKATGPSAWSDWKSSLMQQMYLQIRAYLESRDVEAADSLPGQVAQGVGWLKKKIGELLPTGEEFINLDSLPADYIMKFTPEEVARHVRLHREHGASFDRRSLLQAADNGESWSLLLMTKDRPGLLAKVCGVLTLHNLSVVKAQIFTWDDGTVVDALSVRPTDGLTFAERDWSALDADLDRAIAHRLGLAHRLYRKLKSSRRKESRIEARVVIDNAGSDLYSIIEVHAADVPGMLYYIAQSLADFGLDIHSAYIATEVEQLIDAFYVRDARGEKVIDPDFQAEISHGLLHALRHAGL